VNGETRTIVLLGAAALFMAGACAVRAESAAKSTRIELQNFRTRGMAPDGRVAWELVGERAAVAGAEADVSDVTVVLQPEDSARRVVVMSPRCRLDRARRTVHSTDWLRARSAAFTLYGVGYDIDGDAARLTVHSKVHMRILRVDRWAPGREHTVRKPAHSGHPTERKTNP